MRLDSAGNMGLGVTPSAWASGWKVLQLADSSISNNAANDTYVGANFYFDGTNTRYINSSFASYYGQVNGQHQFFTAASGTAGNTATFTQAMTLDASGNLGIGTTSPTYPITIERASQSTLEIKSGSTTGESRIYFSDTTTAIGAIEYQHNGDYMRFYTNNAERARIDSSGSFFVGATSLSGNAVQIYNNSNQAGRININKTTSGLFNALVNTYSGTTVGGIDYSNTGTAFNTSSDIRLKKDIVDAGSASAKIDQIRIVSHGWKHDDEVVEFGVVAQELVNVAPQAVSTGDNGEEIETTWGVDYSKLVPMLIKAHQEQQAIIETLTARITALEQA